MVNLMNSSSLFRNASRGWDFTISFHIVPTVVRAPMSVFARDEDGWWSIQVRDGRAELAPAVDRRDIDFRKRVEFEAEVGAIEDIIGKRTTIGQALLDDRLVAGGVLAHWAGTLIHLAQSGDDPTRFLSSGHQKAFLKGGRGAR